MKVNKNAPRLTNCASYEKKKGKNIKDNQCVNMCLRVWLFSVFFCFCLMTTFYFYFYEAAELVAACLAA
jgi:hypothetical protein